jgi:hypothetical protein
MLQEPTTLTTYRGVKRPCFRPVVHASSSGPALARTQGPPEGTNLEQVGELGDEPPADESLTR